MHYWQRKTQAMNPLGYRIAFSKRRNRNRRLTPQSVGRSTLVAGISFSLTSSYFSVLLLGRSRDECLSLNHLASPEAFSHTRRHTSYVPAFRI